MVRNISTKKILFFPWLIFEIRTHMQKQNSEIRDDYFGKRDYCQHFGKPQKSLLDVLKISTLTRTPSSVLDILQHHSERWQIRFSLSCPYLQRPWHPGFDNTFCERAPPKNDMLEHSGPYREVQWKGPWSLWLPPSLLAPLCLQSMLRHITILLFPWGCHPLPSSRLPHAALSASNTLFLG